MTGLVFSEVLREMAAILHVSLRRLMRLRTGRQEYRDETDYDYNAQVHAHVATYTNLKECYKDAICTHT